MFLLDSNEVELENGYNFDCNIYITTTAIDCLAQNSNIVQEMLELCIVQIALY